MASSEPTPFVKWAGGKTRLLPQYRPYFPTSFEGYIEPFAGGGAVFFHLHNHGRLADKPVFLVDRIEELVNVYRVIQAQVEALIETLQRHEPFRQDRTYFNEVRAWDRSGDYAQRDGVERAARFLFLNRTCYNGLYRVNQRGEFNVPFGRYRNPTICDADNLRAANKALQGVSVEVGDFDRCLEWAGPEDFVYLDPPYHPLSATSSFTSYTTGSFAVRDQHRLSDLFRELDRRGCRVMLSNSHSELIGNLYRGYDRVVVKAARVISSKGDGRGAIPELLIMNRYDRPTSH
jgi:DNA adenine methylase